MVRCNHCGDEAVTVTCNRCGNAFCVDHRLPGAHDCPAAADAAALGRRRTRHRAAGSTSVPDADPTRGRRWRDWLVAPVAVPLGTARRSLALVGDHLADIVVLAAVAVLVASVVPGVSIVGSLPERVGDLPDQVGGAVDDVPAPAVGTPPDASATDTPRLSDAGSPAPTTDRFERRVEAAVHEAVNEARSDEGVAALGHDDGLRSIARDHSEVMAEEGAIFHDGPDGTMTDRYDRHGYRCRLPTGGGRYATGGENVAKNWYETPVRADGGAVVHDTVDELASAVVTQWMTSPGHRRNMLEPYWRNEGIGVEVVVEDGSYAVYVTQNFC